MTTYVLRYFPIKWRAEVARFMLHASGANFIDELPEWPAARDQQPVGQLPVLIERDASTSGADNEFVLSDSIAIEGYLAGKFGLLAAGGVDARVSARELQLRQQIEDLYHIMAAYVYGHEAGQSMAEERYARLARDFVAFHERLLERNGSNGHYFGEDMTWMDMALYGMFAVLRHPYKPLMPGALDPFSPEKAPQINKVLETVRKDPRSATYRATLEYV